MQPVDLVTLRRSLPGCAIAVWADIITGTVLAADADLPYPQEHLDALGASGATLLGITAPSGADHPADTAVCTTPTGSYAFLRSPDHAAEALCCLYGPAVDPDAVLAAMAGALSVASSDHGMVR